MKPATPAPSASTTECRAEALYTAELDASNRRFDHLFLILLLAEWVALIATASLVSPLAWQGTRSTPPTHL